ncbi:unnamed protein product [Camellia sinensis]
MAREGVRGVFEYLLKRRKVKFDAGQQKGFDSRIVADELLKRCFSTIQSRHYAVGAQAEKKGKEIAEIEEDRGLNKYLKIISTMVIQVMAVEFACKAFRIFRMLRKDPKAVFWTKNHHHQMGGISY